ncbi:MAG: hypothetical protein R3C04_07735 [Hyphomonas sp.]
MTPLLGLSGEEWWLYRKKCSTKVTDPESTFLDRLGNSKYTAFALTLLPQDGKISVDADTIANLGTQFGECV